MSDWVLILYALGAGGNYGAISITSLTPMRNEAACAHYRQVILDNTKTQWAEELVKCVDLKVNSSLSNRELQKDLGR